MTSSDSKVPAGDWVYLEAALRAIPDLRITPHAPLAPLTTLRIGGPVDWLLTPQTMEALSGTIALLDQTQTPWITLGAGSNVLFSDEGYRGAVIHTKGLKRWRIEGHRLISESGVYLSQLLGDLKSLGLSGLEFTVGVPVSVGGAVTMNFGAHGGQISDVLESARVISSDGSPTVLSKEDLQMGYRSTRIQKEKECIAESTFLLIPQDPALIQKKLDEWNAKRLATQPRPFANAGSMFKNPPDDYAGRLIEAADCKGLRVGGMSVSDLHANFFINDGNGTAKDVRELMAQVQAIVHKTFSVKLHPEIRMIGFPDSAGPDRLPH